MSAEEPNKIRALKAEERKEIYAILKSIDLQVLCEKISSKIDQGLDMQCCPERRTYLNSIKADTREFHDFVKRAAVKFEELYCLHGKGRDKYSCFYYDWLQYQTAIVSDALGRFNHSGTTEDNRRTVLIGVLKLRLSVIPIVIL